MKKKDNQKSSKELNKDLNRGNNWFGLYVALLLILWAILVYGFTH